MMYFAKSYEHLKGTKTTIGVGFGYVQLRETGGGVQ